MSKNDHKIMSKIPQDTSSKQMDIFRILLSPDNDPSALSNLIYLWDQIPKYWIPTKTQAQWRKDGVVDNVTRKLDIGNDSYEVEQAPTLISSGGEKALAYYPGSNEEIIESVLRKFLIDQNYGVNNEKDKSTWVKFSLNMIRTELSRLGKTRSNTEIRHSLQILTGAVLTVKMNGKKIHRGPILSNWIDKPHGDDDAELHDQLSAVKLPDMISTSISNLSFIQYDYLTTSKLKNPVARWLNRRISKEFKNTGFERFQPIPYKINFSTIKNESLLLNEIKKPQHQKRKVREAIREMVEAGVLMYKVDEHGKDAGNESVLYLADGKTIDDIIFSLYGSRDFVAKMKASNKRRQITQN